MRYFCTYFDKHYLARALALYESLRLHCGKFQLWALCMDDLSHRVLAKLNLPSLTTIKLEELENSDRELFSVKQTRSAIEYYFTCTPCLPFYIFQRYSAVGFLTYLDADLYFFSSLDPIYHEIGQSSIAIVEHRFPPNLRYLNKYGLYNVGFLGFKRDEAGRACLKWWREKCIEWCYDRCEIERYADQKYLDHFTLLFENVCIIKHIGANLAPWNVANYKIVRRDGVLWVDTNPLIFYHFHNLREINKVVFNPSLDEYGVSLTKTLKKYIYAPYIQTLKRIDNFISNFIDEEVNSNGIRWEDKPEKVAGRKSPKQLWEITKGIFNGKYMLSLI